MKNPFMTCVKVSSDYAPIFDAYCRGQGILFKLLLGGWRRLIVDKKTGISYNYYNIWPMDKEFLRYQCAMLPFDDDPVF